MTNTRIPGRTAAYGGALLGGAVSIAANVAHSYVPPTGAGTGWQPQSGAVVSAGYAFGQFSETSINNASSGLGIVMLVAFLGLSWLLSRKLDQIVARY